MKKIAIVLFAVIGIYGNVSAQQPAVVASDKTGWHKIAETVVNFDKDRDEVMVVGADRFAQLKFKVTDAPINLISIEVYYEDDTKQNIAVNFPIKVKGESKAIDIKGGEKSIKKIVLVYKTEANSTEKKAHVEIWGMKTNTAKK
jgi:protein involved in sex pheromone biosynthesis